jgi:hypothetical protein
MYVMMGETVGFGSCFKEVKNLLIYGYSRFQSVFNFS